MACTLAGDEEDDVGDGVSIPNCHCAAAQPPSGGAESEEEEEIISVRTGVEELVKRDMERLVTLREAWGGRAGRVEARMAYFDFLRTWRWELEAVDREYVAEWFDKDANAMLVFVTMLTPHVYDSTCGLEECLPWTKEEIDADFSASEGLCAKAFLEHNDERRALFSCAACGIRDPTLAYTLLPISSPKVVRYQYSTEQARTFEGASGNYRQLKSSYLWEGQGRFHLHQELVSAPADAGGCPTAQFCEVCLRGRKPAPLSIAAGVDFGCAARLQLPVPSTVEKCILARYRLYATTLKLRTAGGTESGVQLSGHCVCIPHDAPQAVLTLADVINSTKKEVAVVFLGNKKLLEHSFAPNKLGRYLRADVGVLRAWAAVLSDATIRADAGGFAPPGTFDDHAAALAELPRAILANAEGCLNEAEEEFLMNADATETDDLARVRAAERARVPEGDVMDGAGGEGEAERAAAALQLADDVPISFDSSALAPKESSIHVAEGGVVSGRA
jgi:hypothetical protein